LLHRRSRPAPRTTHSAKNRLFDRRRRAAERCVSRVVELVASARVLRPLEDDRH
jgi:hypothetical protein